MSKKTLIWPIHYFGIFLPTPKQESLEAIARTFDIILRKKSNARLIAHKIYLQQIPMYLLMNILIPTFIYFSFKLVITTAPAHCGI